MKYIGAIGVFDGVHRGHQAILRRALQCAARVHGLPVAITFDRHPLRTLAPHLAPRCLQTLQQRLETLSKMGFRRIIVMPFTAALARLSPRQFIQRFLVRRFRLAELIVGYDFHFGRGGTGNARSLTELGRESGIKVTIIPPILDRGEPVSSTRIRKLVSLAKLNEATRLLGRQYAVMGRCVRGAGRGRKIGFPTINVRPENELLPPFGVYAVRMGPAGWSGVANLGLNPTFAANSPRPVLEVHLLSTRRLKRRPARTQVSLIKYLRPERKFPGISALKRQIGLDRDRASRLFRGGYA